MADVGVSYDGFRDSSSTVLTMNLLQPLGPNLSFNLF